jgi:hypothetical protein
VRRLQAENPLVPLGIMGEANVFDLEVSLLFLPFFRPRQMGFVELLPEFGNFERIGRRKQDSEADGIAEHHDLFG